MELKITGIGLRTAQRIIKTWKDSGEPSSSRKKCGWKKILNDHDLKRLVKWKCKKSSVELTAMFNSESKSISTDTMRRELKGTAVWQLFLDRQCISIMILII